MANYKTFAEWRFEVDRQFRIRTRKACDELNCEPKRLREAFDAKIPPPEFVVQWIRMHGLTDYTTDARY